MLGESPLQALLVDDEPDVRLVIRHWLTHAGYSVTEAGDGSACIAALERTVPDVVLLDLSMPVMDGLTALDIIQARFPDVPVIVVSGSRSVETAVEAVQRGAFDYIGKPVQQARLVERVAAAAADSRARASARRAARSRDGGYPGIIGRSPAMLQLFDEIDRVGSSDIPVLVLGESGTGKELVARALHDINRRRKSRPFVPLNCAAIPPSMQESELFGHERGAFTGAHRRRAGRLEQADGGTLFLDELGELSLELQAKLLRALQEKAFYRVGGDTELSADFRLVSATNADLPSDIAAGRFRQDLYYRVACYELRLPPLRVRGDDVLLIARHMLASARDGQPLDLAPAVVDRLRAYDWPGNVRELGNVMQRVAVLARGSAVQLADLPPSLHGGPVVSVSAPPGRPPMPSAPLGRPALDPPGRPALDPPGRPALDPPGRPALDPPGRPAFDPPGRPSFAPPGRPSSAPPYRPSFEPRERLSFDPSASRPSVEAAVAPPSTPRRFIDLSTPRTMADIEREAITIALERNDGDVNRAAAELAMSRATLYRRIKRYGQVGATD